MTIRDVSLWLLNVGSMKLARCAVTKHTHCVRSTAVHVAVLAAALMSLAPAAAMAQTQAHAAVKRGDDPLSRLMWSPPPPDAPWIYNEAQWGLPSAPFVFTGDTLYVGGSFESARPVFIGFQARFHTAADTRLHLSGVIDAHEGSAGGLVKEGPGTLVLSGPNSYRGNTVVEQGTLHVAGNTALGQHVRNLELYGGTTLSYGDGVTVFNGMQLVAQPGTDSVTWRVDTGTATQIGTVLGHVPIIKQGEGTLVVGGFVTALMASAIVKQGALSVAGDFNGSVLVNRGARLEGSGTVGAATVQDGGVLAPGAGTSPSTMSITRTLSFESGATLQVDADPAGAADFVDVGGKALLAGEVHARTADGDWQPSTDYIVLRAEEGFDGTKFDSASASSPFLQASLSYDEQAVTLRLDRNSTPLDEVAETPTEEGVADAVENIENPVLRDEVVRMDAGQARDAFNQLSGSWGASVLSGLLEDSRFVREAALRHGGGPVGFWHEAFYSSADRGAQAGQPADTRDIGGLVLGRNHEINPAWRASGFFAVQRSDLMQRVGRDDGGAAAARLGGVQADVGSVHAGRGSASAGIDSVYAGLGLAGRWRGVDLAMGTAYAWHKIRSQRRIALGSLREALTGRYSAESLQLFAEVSAPLRWLASQGRLLAERAREGRPYSGGVPAADGVAGDGTSASDGMSMPHGVSAAEDASSAPSISPYLRLAWVQASTDPYAERGGAAALQVQGQRRGVLFTGLGLKAAHTITTGKGAAHLQGEVGWRHASGDVRGWSRQHFHEAGAGRTFTSEGHAVARQAWLLRLGIDGDLARHVKVGVAYGGQFSRGVQDHGARLDVRWFF